VIDHSMGRSAEARMVEERRAEAPDLSTTAPMYARIEQEETQR
jgi:hypothetical protein